MRWLVLTCGVVLSGCLTHIAPTATAYRALPWAASFEEAQQLARAQHKPLLVVLAAGPRDGRC
jgi:hypothetical protein